jgi:hypothetical protein
MNFEAKITIENRLSDNYFDYAIATGAESDETHINHIIWQLHRADVKAQQSKAAAPKIPAP